MTIAPRIEVFTQLSCSRLHHSYNHTASTWFEAASVLPPIAPLYFGLDPLGPQFNPEQDPALTVLDPTEDEPWDEGETGGDDPRRLPSPRCISDPAVQAGTGMYLRPTTSSTNVHLVSPNPNYIYHNHGFTECFDNWMVGPIWRAPRANQGSRNRHPRLVHYVAIFTIFYLAFVQLLHIRDLTFILASTPSSPLSSHGHKLLIIAPVIEGLLGGWSTLQSATSAYISDCTSSGSRASMFSRFTGVSFLGFGVRTVVLILMRDTKINHSLVQSSVVG
jgi:hypothetical protein